MFNPFLHSGYVKVFGPQPKASNPNPRPNNDPPLGRPTHLHSEKRAGDLGLTKQEVPEEEDADFTRRLDPEPHLSKEPLPRDASLLYSDVCTNDLELTKQGSPRGDVTLTERSDPTLHPFDEIPPNKAVHLCSEDRTSDLPLAKKVVPEDNPTPTPGPPQSSGLLQSGIVAADIAPPATDLPHITCNRCQTQIQSTHWHCPDCNGGIYNICIQCAERGAYCSDDGHGWVERSIKDSEQCYMKGGTSLPQIPRMLEISKSAIYPSKFRASSTAAEALFKGKHRFIRKANSREILIYADGNSKRQNETDWTGVWSFAYRPHTYDQQGALLNAGHVTGTLEPEMDMDPHSARVFRLAALRAAVAALQFRDWAVDCNRSWRSLVIASRLEYIEKGATTWLPIWEKNGWQITDRKEKGKVRNPELWRTLLKEVRSLKRKGVDVSFWHISQCSMKKALKATYIEPKIRNPSSHLNGLDKIARQKEVKMDI